MFNTDKIRELVQENAWMKAKLQEHDKILAQINHEIINIKAEQPHQLDELDLF